MTVALLQPRLHEDCLLEAARRWLLWVILAAARRWFLLRLAYGGNDETARTTDQSIPATHSLLDLQES